MVFLALYISHSTFSIMLQISKLIEKNTGSIHKNSVQLLTFVGLSLFVLLCRVNNVSLSSLQSLPNNNPKCRKGGCQKAVVTHKGCKKNHGQINGYVKGLSTRHQKFADFWGIVPIYTIM